MADTKSPPQYEDTVTPSKDANPATDHVEKTKGNDVFDEKQLVQGRDYAGAVAKTDPREIKLVRKLDMRIMVGCGFLNGDGHG